MQNGHIQHGKHQNTTLNRGSQTQSKIWQSAARFVGILTIRLINALTIRTFFQPDEYFQSLEPAWQLAFGEDSGAWLTWVG